MSQENNKFEFQAIPPEYNLLKDSINDEILKKIYSLFDFHYYKIQIQEDNVQFLHNFLNEYRFITYEIIPISKNNSSTFDTQENENQHIEMSNLIICIEGKCLIVESIKANSINLIFNDKSSIINVETNIYDEVSKFIKHFQQQTNTNSFVKMTIKPIISYIIRRHFYPSYYFKDPSFFSFPEKSKKDKKYDKQDIINKVESDKQKISKPKNIYNFDMDNFFILKTIHGKENSYYYLVIHLENLHIFLMKTINNEEKYIKYEKNFCQNYRHRCFNKFYGFVMEHNKIVGFLYEYLNNGTLNGFISKKELNIDSMYIIMTMIRIVEGVNYLHSNNLIYRDLKPANILINHNYIPYISDFETIRENDGEDFTTNLGSNTYSSPEQLSSNNYSFPTDIYSLGKIFYFMINSVENLKHIPSQQIFQRCINFKPEDRPKINEIQDFIFQKVNLFDSLDASFLLDNCEIIQNPAIRQYYKEIYYLLFVLNETSIQDNIINLIQLLLIIDNHSVSDIFCSVANIFFNGKIIPQNYTNAIKYFELSSKLDNIKATFSLGLFSYQNKNYIEAKKYFELAAKQKLSCSYLMLGELYIYGNGVEKDYKKAREYYEMAIHNDDDEVQFKKIAYNQIGNIYFNGYGIKKDYSIAKKYYELGKEVNDGYSLFNLGIIYFNGDGVEKDYIKAKKCYKLAAKQKNANAYFNLGSLYYYGYGVEKDFGKAIYYYELAAKHNITPAFYNLGNMYYFGEGVIQNFAKAKENYELAAEQNSSEGINRLGQLYFYGHGVNQDFARAKKYFEKSAEQNNSYALFNLGVLYYHGYGVEQNYSKAIEYYELAVKQNNPDALNSLGIIYYHGYGVEQNYSKAIEYYELAAKQNNSNGLNSLGIIYCDGKCVKQDFIKARGYFEKAVQQNNHNSLFNLGYLYYHGRGVNQSYSKARKYFELSAIQNNPDSLLYLGQLYLHGYECKIDYHKARYYLEKSAIQNNSNACNTLGIIYLLGLGVACDYSKSKKYFEISAQQNNSTAIINLGEIYYYGYGIKRDYCRAKELFESAIQLKNDDAFYDLAKLYRSGKGVPKDYLLAKHYFEVLTKKNNTNAFYQIGKLYYHGQGVKQDINLAIQYFKESAKENNQKAFYYLGLIYKNEKKYMEAKKYFELSSYFNNPKAFYQIGILYYYGIGLKQNYELAKSFFEISSKKNNLNACFYLGLIYEKGAGVSQDISTSILYYSQCASNKRSQFISIIDDLYDINNITNEHYYQSNNDVGLIYITEKDYFNINLAEKYLKEAGYNEYPFGQNNLGLYYQYYVNDLAKAEYFYQKASGYRFALSEFNLGHMFEENGNFEYINHYKKVIEYGNENFVFHNNIIKDERLEISKTFILSYTNLKLSLYHITQKIQFNEKKSNEYFLYSMFLSLFDLLLYSKQKSYAFNFRTITKNGHKILAGLKEFLINNPLYFPNNQNEVLNHGNLNVNWDSKDPISVNHIQIFLNVIGEEKIDNLWIKNIQNKKCDKNANLRFKEALMNVFNYLNNKNQYEYIKENDHDEFNETFSFKYDDKIFDIIYPKKLCKLFINNYIELKDNIVEIIDEMNKILFTPPYKILFGRINIYTANQNININCAHNINEQFYEGFGLN